MTITADEAMARAEQTEGYESYFWFLVAADLDEGEAEAYLDSMREVDLVADEDVHLAHFQLACWYANGTHLARDAKKARAHLKDALAGYKVKLDKDLARAIAQARECLGLPDDLDLAASLGPAMPGTPGNVGTGQLDKTAPPLRGEAPSPRPKKPLAPTEDVYAVAASPDGRWLLSGGVCGELLLWDLATRTAVRRLKNAGGSVVDAIHFAASGTRAVLSSQDSLWIRVLDLETNDFVVLKGHKQSTHARFVANDTQLVAGDHGGQLWLWDLATKRPIAKRDHGEDIWSLAVSPDRRLVAVGDGRYKIGLYSVPELERVAVLDAHTHLIVEMAFDATGTRLLSASRDDMVGVWEVPSGALVDLLADHDDVVYTVIATPDGGAVSADLKGRILCWNLATKRATEVARGKSVHGLALVGDTLVSGGEGGVQFHDLKT